jgi:hypothetical protein
VLALLLPLFVWLDVGWPAVVPVTALYLLAPVVHFFLLLHMWSPLPEGEPCRRSGTVLGIHWFEFGSAPGLRFVTRDTHKAAEVRARPWPLPGEGGFELTLAPPADARPPFLFRVLRQVLFSVCANMALGFLWGVFWTVVISGLEPGMSPLESLGGLLGMGSVVGLAPSMVVVWMFYGGLLLAKTNIDRLLLRRTRSIRWSGSQLHVGSATAYLDTPGNTVVLGHDAYDTGSWRRWQRPFGRGRR